MRWSPRAWFQFSDNHDPLFKLNAVRRGNSLQFMRATTQPCFTCLLMIDTSVDIVKKFESTTLTWIVLESSQTLPLSVQTPKRRNKKYWSQLDFCVSLRKRYPCHTRCPPRELQAPATILQRKVCLYLLFWQRLPSYYYNNIVRKYPFFIHSIHLLGKWMRIVDNTKCGRLVICTRNIA